MLNIKIKEQILGYILDNNIIEYMLLFVLLLRKSFHHGLSILGYESHTNAFPTFYHSVVGNNLCLCQTD